MESSFGDISRGMANWTMKLISMFFFRAFSIVSTNFHLDRQRRFLYEFIFEKLVLLSFSEYLGEIESGKKKPHKISKYVFFLHEVQGRVRGSAPNV